MFHSEVILPAPFHKIELFGLVEPVATDFGKPMLVNSLYMVCPYAEGGRVLLHRFVCSKIPEQPDIGGA